jgi:outer membrane murein-binding lipoprotein Lpp
MSIKTKRPSAKIQDKAMKLNSKAHVLRSQVDSLEQVTRRLRRELEATEREAQKAWVDFSFASAKETETRD